MLAKVLGEHQIASTRKLLAGAVVKKTGNHYTIEFKSHEHDSPADKHKAMDRIADILSEEFAMQVEVPQRGHTIRLNAAPDSPIAYVLTQLVTGISKALPQ